MIFHAAVITGSHKVTIPESWQTKKVILISWIIVTIIIMPCCLAHHVDFTEEKFLCTFYWKKIFSPFHVNFCSLRCDNWAEKIPFTLSTILQLILGSLISRNILKLLKVAQNSFQHIPRLRFWWVIITTVYQLMLQPWYQNTAQSLVNTLVIFSWHSRYSLVK